MPSACVPRLLRLEAITSPASATLHMVLCVKVVQPRTALGGLPSSSCVKTVQNYLGYVERPVAELYVRPPASLYALKSSFHLEPRLSGLAGDRVDACCARGERSRAATAVSTSDGRLHIDHHAAKRDWRRDWISSATKPMSSTTASATLVPRSPPIINSQRLPSRRPSSPPPQESLVKLRPRKRAGSDSDIGGSRRAPCPRRGAWLGTGNEGAARLGARIALRSSDHLVSLVPLGGNVRRRPAS
ncbi:hypothetical protein BD310DRAFT_310611 [Dichomitus squalens]|uniref:Uncharacterized protein n=1 Tax=Dichomitus squalens TaxID=114155 RepID=A0A4Q9Q0L5_9APHY|nr:hypothetical protein BD310DRAFT_310611 [Dichomitus squalens]